MILTSICANFTEKIVKFGSDEAYINPVTGIVRLRPMAFRRRQYHFLPSVLLTIALVFGMTVFGTTVFGTTVFGTTVFRIALT